MPVYEFKCEQDCGGNVFEVIVPYTQRMLNQKCPHCGGTAVWQQARTAPAFVVSGYNAKNGYSKEGS